MRHHTIVCLTLVPASVALAGTAAAQNHERDSPHAVASCEYRQGEDGRTTTIKRCGVVGNGSEFNVRIARDQAVVVRLDEAIETVVPNRDPHMQIETAESFAVYDLKSGKLPKDWSSTIQTASYAVTLRFELVRTRGDSQLHISRADRADRDAEVERRVNAARAELEAAYKDKFDALDTKATALARRHNVQQLQAGHSTASPGTRPTRHDFVVLRAERLIRIGSTRYLQISVDNRDRPTLRIGDITAWLERGDAQERVDAIYSCGTKSVRAGRRTRCTLGLDLSSVPSKRDRLRVRVDSVDGKRSVTLGGIHVR